MLRNALRCRAAESASTSVGRMHMAIFARRATAAAATPARIPSARLSSGHSIPRFGVGTWSGGDPPALAAAAVRTAIAAGCRHVDTATFYETEGHIGAALAPLLAPGGGLRRAELFVTTKLWNSEHEASRVRPAFDRSLEALRLDYVDLYLMHWPVAFESGRGMFPEGPDGRVRVAPVPVSETWRAMEALVDAGLSKSVGVSNFKIKDLKDLLSYARIQPAVNQVELHPYLSQRPLLDFCAQNGIHVTAYSPLGAQKHGNPNAIDLLADPTLGAIAKRIGRSPAQVALRWSLQRAEHVSVIPKSYDPKQILENMDACSFALSEGDMRAIEGLDRGYRTCRHEWTNYYNDGGYEA